MGLIDKVIQDVWIAVRHMRRFPASTLAAVTTLAVCIGANTAIFSLVQATLLTPLPYPNADRLVMIWKPAETGEVTNISLRELLGYRESTRSLERVSGYIEANATFTDGGDPDRVRIALVSVDLFDTLQVQPARGAGFQPRDAAPGAEPTVVLGHSLWVRQFGSRPDIVGQMIRVSGTPRLVRGVMPEDFKMPLDYRAARATEAWLPLQVDPANLGGWGSRSILGVGRLRDGANPQQVANEFAAIGDNWIRQGFVADQGDGRMHREAVLLNDLVTGEARRALLIVFGAVAVVLLIACATVANLLLAKAEARREEIAVRAALGAGRSRIARQLLTESLLLAGVSGALGVALAEIGIRILQSIPATTIPRAQEASINPGVMFFALAVALGTGLLFGMVPMIRLSRPDVGPALPLGEIQTMEHITAAALAQPRLTTMLLGLLAALALALASLGVYSTVSVLVTERTREIGIRVALGAERTSILRLVASEGALLAATGLGLGIAGALLLTRLLEGLLYGVDPLDPLTFATVPTVLAVLTMLACLQPARRAMAVDPVVTLRKA